MTRPDQCDGCSQADDCKGLRRQLGDMEGPPVTRAVLVAFLLPLVLFIAWLGTFDWLLKSRSIGSSRTPLALILALLVTAGLMLALRAVSRRGAGKRSQN